MRDLHYGRIAPASVALVLMLAAPSDSIAQGLNEQPATFEERFPADPSPTQSIPEAAKADQERNVTTTRRIIGAKRTRSRVVVVPRSFLDAGTEVLPGERKFLDYAFPPVHPTTEVVTNTGGRVGLA